MTLTKEMPTSYRCLVQCKDCKQCKRHSYYLSKCKETGRKVSRNKEIYCDFFVAKPEAKKEAESKGIKIEKRGAWIKGKRF